MSPRGRVVAGVGVSLGLAVGVLLGFLIMKLGHASDQIEALDSAGLSRDRAISALASGDSQLRSQVRALGGTPQVPPPQVIISGVAGIPGAQGVPGVAGSQGAVGSPGAPGSPGVSITGPSGPAGPQGEPGVGQTGPAGQPGQDGAPGSPPAGWSFVAGGVTYDCVPDNGTPAPHYTCPPRSPSPSQSASPSGSGTPPATSGPIASPTDSATPRAPSPSPSATTTAFLVPLAHAQTHTPAEPRPSGPRSGLLLLAPSYLPLSRRTA